MHQLLMERRRSGLEIDHKNHNGLDNRRENLRLVTRSQNHANRRKQTACASQFKGVVWSAGNRKWKAQLQLTGRNPYLGYFATEHEAAAAYDRAARAAFGEHALTNGIDWMAKVRTNRRIHVRALERVRAADRARKFQRNKIRARVRHQNGRPGE